MADHEELVSEMASVSKLSIQERLQLAKRRRQQQLQCYDDTDRKSRDVGGADAHAQKQTKTDTGSKRDRQRVRFDSRTRLFEAAARNDSNEVRSLLKSSECQSNTRNADGFTILHQCCIDGDVDLIRNLIEAFGCSVNLPDDELWTPLHTVALCGRSEVSKLLIDHGADLLALNIDGNMPYDICEDDETLDVIEAEMSKRGITQEQIEELRMTKEAQMLQDLRELSAEDLEHRGLNGETPLHVAAANGYLSVAKFLLEAMVTVDPEDNDFWQPIHCAAKWRQLPVLELLIVNGAELTSQTRDGKTPLDLCDDPDIQSWMKELRREVETKQTSLATSHQRLMDIIASRTSVQMQTTSAGNGSNGQLYSSNMSLAEAAKASSSNRHLPSSAKESMAKKSAQEEESTISLSLQSLVEGKAADPTSAELRPVSVSQSDDIVKINDHLVMTSSQNQIPTKTGEVMTSSNATNNSLNNNGHNGPLNHRTPTTEANGRPKSCLKSTASADHHSRDELNNNSSRKRRMGSECCTIS